MIQIGLQTKLLIFVNTTLFLKSVNETHCCLFEQEEIMKKEIAKLLVGSSALPVLFVGSGLTRRYLDLPNWEGLLRKFCVKSFEYYYDKAERTCRDHIDMLYPTLADYIEQDFNETWYTDDKYKQSREKHAEDLRKKISPFKICIADYICNASENIQEKYSTEIDKFKAIGSKNISCIITTNYDTFLESNFGKEAFQTYIGQSELLFSTIYEVAEIYKIHGCCSKPESIVINSYDYERFNEKSAYLSSKILTLFLERPIIFLGYSISDPNIRRILQSISDCLENEQLQQLKERLIFIEWNSDPSISDSISEKLFDFNNGKTITMKNVLLTQYGDLYDAILENTVKYDVRALRRIKSQLYELIKTNKPTEKLYVATSIDNPKADVDFVVGVGVYGKFGKVGYRGLRSEELYLYALGKSELEYDDEMILKEAIPSLHNGRSTLPVCQFVSKCKSKDCINEKVKFSLKNRFEEILSCGEVKRIKDNGHFKMDNLTCYYETYGLSKTLSKIPLIAPQSIKPDSLFQFLNKVLEDNPDLLEVSKGHQSRSQFKKCISIWDWLKYSDAAKKQIKIFEEN